MLASNLSELLWLSQRIIDKNIMFAAYGEYVLKGFVLLSRREFCALYLYIKSFNNKKLVWCKKERKKKNNLQEPNIYA